MSNGMDRTIAAERGLAWWREGWALYMRNPLLWSALGLILIVLLGAVSVVPVLGSLASALLAPPFVGGWMLSARKVHDGGVLEVADLFSGFKGEHFAPLLVQGAVLLAAAVVVLVVAGVLGMGAMMGLGGTRHHGGAAVATALGAGLATMLVMLLVALAITLAMWFGPALVVFRQRPAVDALRESAAAVLRHWLPFLVYGAIGVLAAIAASIPFGLGWIVLVPVSLLTGYTSWRDVFAAEDAAAA